MAVSSPSSFDLSTTLDIFMLLMLSRFYFCGDEGVGSGALIDIVQQMRGDRGIEIRRVHPGAARRDIVPLLLGETYHGIDRLSGTSEFMGSGSPTLLSLWLYERLDLLGPVPEGQIVRPWMRRPRRVDAPVVVRSWQQADITV